MIALKNPLLANIAVEAKFMAILSIPEIEEKKRTKKSVFDD